VFTEKTQFTIETYNRRVDNGSLPYRKLLLELPTKLLQLPTKANEPPALDEPPASLDEPANFGAPPPPDIRFGIELPQESDALPSENMNDEQINYLDEVCEKLLDHLSTPKFAAGHWVSLKEITKSLSIDYAWVSLAVDYLNPLKLKCGGGDFVRRIE
ncbi:MAG: hypothetical protein VSS75_033705, partial [Candidatus Parabeggiatoa sp.]|nr:hypothetical protein [Candidatus Parabeggiatoa sp.]